MGGLTEKVASGALWVTFERFSCLGVRFFVGMVLARLLTPNDYGTVALLSIFFAIAESLATCGFGNALVQKKEVTELDFNSVFYTSLVVSIFIYFVLFFSAPYIADYYRVPVLCPITRVSAIQFVLSAINSVQGAELSRKMLFNKRFKISLITCWVSAFLGVLFAYLGWGPWALVWSSLLTSVVSVIAWWTIIAWRPKMMFSFASVKGLFSYGWKLSASGLIHTTYMNMYGFLIGRAYSPADLAYVNKGNAMPNLFLTIVDGTITGVSFPALAKLQDDKERMRDAMRRMIQCSTFLIFPFMVGTAVCARPLIFFLYGDQWAEAVPYAQIACLSFAMWPFGSINTMAISALGRSDIYLILEIVKKGVGFILMFFAFKHGVFFFMCVMAIVQQPFTVIANTFVNGRLLRYSLVMQLKDVFSSIALSAVMAGVVLTVNSILTSILPDVLPTTVSCLIVLLVNFIVGASTYLSLAIFFRTKPCCEYAKMISPSLKKRAPGIAAKMERFLQ